MTTSTVLPQRAAAAARQLRARMRGDVLAAADAGYDTARRIWNGAIDRHPALIARCADDQDVAAAVRTAREHDLPLSVRGGGHDWSGRALREGGLVLDLSAQRGVTVDPAAGTAVAQGGATAGDVVTAAARYGLAPVTGTVKAVGMAGLRPGRRVRPSVRPVRPRGGQPARGRPGPRRRRAGPCRRCWRH